MTEIYEVPWMIEGGAKHTVQVARNLSFLAAGGSEGVVQPNNLQVRELAIPGTSVRVAPGTAAILNRAAGAQDEAYVMRVGAQETVDVPPTDSTGGRSDMVVARVKNPWASGETWPDPADPAVGPYADLALISDVPPNARTVADLGLSADHTMLPLARLDIPASTGTITQDMIVDLRRLVAPRREQIVRIHNLTDGAVGAALTNTSYEMWPRQANWDIEIPEWAVRAQVQANIAGYGIVEEESGIGGNVLGGFRTRLGSMTSDPVEYNYSAPAGLGWLDAGASFVAADHYLDRSVRGTTQNLSFEGRYVSGTNTHLETRAGTVVAFTVIFYEAPDEQGWEQ